MPTSIVSIHYAILACVCQVWNCMVKILFRTSQLLLFFVGQKNFRIHFSSFAELMFSVGKNINLTKLLISNATALKFMPLVLKSRGRIVLSFLLHIFSLIPLFLFNSKKTKFKTLILKYITSPSGFDQRVSKDFYEHVLSKKIF